MGTEVTDQGLARLEDAGRLQRLYVWGSAVTPGRGPTRLAAARPGLEVERGADLERFLEALEEEETASLRSPCCDAAAAEGRVCDHPCCVEAAAQGVVCPTCGVADAGDAGAEESGE